jgi:lipoprotein signal peptidase
MKQGVVIWNRGGFFGLIPSMWWGLVLFVLWLYVVYEWLRIQEKYWWGMGLVVVGGLGNLVDRWEWAAVRDFIYYPFLGIYGNVADIALVVGVLLLLRSYMEENPEKDGIF